MTIRCPAFRRAFVVSGLPRSPLLPRPVLVLATLPAATFPGRSPAAGGAPWDALPLRKWLAEDRAEPQALSFCAPPECSPGLVVSVIDLTGKDADITEAASEGPGAAGPCPALARRPREAGEDPDRGRAPRNGSLSGASPSISRRPTAASAPAYGAAFGRRTGETLDLVLVDRRRVAGMPCSRPLRRDGR